MVQPNTPGRPDRSRTVIRAATSGKRARHLGTAGEVAVDVTDQPCLQAALDLLGGLERAHHVAPDDLDVMGKARNAQHRVDLRREARIGVGGGGRGADEARRRLQAAHRREHRLLAIGQRGERHQPGLDQRCFQPVGKDHVERRPHPDMVGIGAERLDRQIGHEPAADIIGLAAAHVGRPSVIDKGARDDRGKGVARASSRPGEARSGAYSA